MAEGISGVGIWGSSWFDPDNPFGFKPGSGNGNFLVLSAASTISGLPVEIPFSVRPNQMLPPGQNSVSKWFKQLEALNLSVGGSSPSAPTLAAPLNPTTPTKGPLSPVPSGAAIGPVVASAPPAIRVKGKTERKAPENKTSNPSPSTAPVAQPQATPTLQPPTSSAPQPSVQSNPQTNSSSLAITPVKTPEPDEVTIQQISQAIPVNHLSPSEKATWAQNIADEMKRNGLPLTKSDVAFVLSAINREGSFRPNPIVGDPERILKMAKAKYRRELEAYYVSKAIPQSVYDNIDGFLEDVYKSYGLSTARTEGEVEEKWRKLRDDQTQLVQEAKNRIAGQWASLIPDVLVRKGLDKLNRNPVTTVGAMQVNVQNAYQVATQEEGRTISEEDFRKELYTREGNLHYGIRYAARILKPYRQRTDLTEEEKIRFASADYQAGLLSSRNAKIQEYLTEVTGIDLSKDGDLLVYDRDTKVATFRPSQTEVAFQKFAKSRGLSVTDSQIRQMLLEEKTNGFEATVLYQELIKAIQEKYQTDPNWRFEYAAIPRDAGASEDVAKVKYGGANIDNQRYTDNAMNDYNRIREKLPA